MLPWPLQQLTGTQEELTSSEDWFTLADLWRVSSLILKEITPLLQKQKPKTKPKYHLVLIWQCVASPWFVALSFLHLTKTHLKLVTFPGLQLRRSMCKDQATLEQLVPEKVRAEGRGRRITGLRTIRLLFVVSICLANWLIEINS